MNKIFEALLLITLLASTLAQIPIIVPLRQKPVPISDVPVAATSTVPLTNLENLQFAGQITIGSPSQVFEVVFDTFYADTAIYSTNCSQCPTTPHRYNPEASTTSNDELLQVTFSGYDTQRAAQCEVYSDDVRIGNYVLPDAEILVIEKDSNIPVRNLSVDGVMGLGYKASVNFSLTPFGKLMALQGVPRVFSLYLTSGVNQSGSSLTFGGYDNTLAPKGFTYHNVVTNNTWQLKLNDFGYNGTSYSNDATLQAVMTSTLPMIVGNAQVMTSILSVLPESGSCSAMKALPSVYFTIEGMRYEIPASIFYYEVLGSCSLMMSNDTRLNMTVPANTIYLGIPFIQSYYTTFDMENQRVGFAQGSSPVPPEPVAALRLEAVTALISLAMGALYLIL